MAPALLLGCVCLLIQGVQSQYYAIWNGTIISGPVLIYQDEIVVDNRGINAAVVDGTLICRNENGSVRWYIPTGGTLFHLYHEEFIQASTDSGVIPGVARVSAKWEDVSVAGFNGLWTCKDTRLTPNPIVVGIYNRTRGLITSTRVYHASSSSYLSDPPTFTLFGNTRGGPPTTYTWTRDGVVLSNSSEFDISLQATNFRDSEYCGTLIVTGRRPGRYQYSVTNRATPNVVAADFIIDDGTPPTAVTAEQISSTQVHVMWTPPSIPPALGYQVLITVDNTTTTTNVGETSYNLSIVNNQYGAYSIQVRSRSQHFPFDGDENEPVEITVRGFMPPVISTTSFTATSVTITWTQPEFSLPLTGYTVTVTRRSSQELSCPLFVEETKSVTTLPSVAATTCIGLQEFSDYTVTVTANFSPVFGLLSPSSAESYVFTTLSSVPTGTPSNIIYSVTSTSVTITWSAIECIERNGEITDYMVVFQDQGGAMISGEVNVMDRTFTASGLIPHTNYTFSVAGVNSNGTGPFSDSITVYMMMEFEEADDAVTTPCPNQQCATRSTEPTTTEVTMLEMNVEVEVISASSVRVSWDSLDIPEITGYIVYYSQTGNSEIESPQFSVNASNSDFIVIEGLMSNVEYQFEVVAVAELDGDVVVRHRSLVSTALVATTTQTNTCVTAHPNVNGILIISVVVTFVLTVLLYSTLLVMIYCIYGCRHVSTKSKLMDTVEGQAVYEQVADISVDKEMEMSGNEAYSSSQPPPPPPPPPVFEGAKDL